MLEVNDYSNLTEREARERYIKLANRIFAEQFHQDFFIKDPRPERYLKFEIIAFWEGRIQELHGWTDPLGQVARWIVDRVRSALSWLWTSLIQPGVRAIVSSFRWLWDAAVSWARSAYNTAVNVWNRVISIHVFLTTTLFSTVQRIWNTLAGIGRVVYDNVRSALSVVRDVFVMIWNTHIRPGIEVIVGGFRWIWDAAVEWAQKAVTWAQNAYNAIVKAWESITERISGAFETLVKAVAGLPQVIGSAFQNAISFLGDVLKHVWQDIFVPIGQKIMEGMQWIANKLGEVFNTAWNAIKSMLTAIAPVTPDRAENAGLTALKIAGLAAGGLLAMTAAWDLIHPVKDIIPGEIKAMIYDVTNFKLILGALAGSLVFAAITQPARYFYNSIFMPKLPDVRQLIELRSRGKLSKSDYAKYLKYHGFAPHLHDYFEELAITPVRYFALNAVARSGYFDEAFFSEELQRSGYSQRAQEVMLQMYRQTANEAARGYYGSVVIRRYRAGIVDRDGLAEELKMLGYPETQRDQLITGAELYYDLDTVEDYVDAIRYSYRRGKITIDELRSKLASLGIRDDRIQRIVAIELSRAKEDVGSTEQEEVRAYGRGTVIKRFREGLITPVELVEELRMLGYSEQWIERLRHVALLERDYDFAMTVLSYVKTAYRKRKIDDTRFIEILRSFGFTDEKISLELSLLKLAYGLGLEEEEVAS